MFILGKRSLRQKRNVYRYVKKGVGDKVQLSISLI